MQQHPWTQRIVQLDLLHLIVNRKKERKGKETVAMKVVTLVVLMVASFGITATTGVPTQQCQDTYNQDCTSGQASQQVDKMKCCNTITMMLFSMDTTCICDIFAAQGLSTEASIISYLNTTCNFKYNGRLPCGVSPGNGTTSPLNPSAPAPSTSRGGGVNPVASPKGAPVPPIVSPSAGSVGSPAPPSQSPTSALPPRPSASSPSAAGSVGSPPSLPSQSPTSALPPRPSASSPSADGSVESPPAPPSGGPNSAPPPTEGQTSGHSPKNDFPPESPLPERNPKAALPPSEGWRSKAFFNSFGLTAMYIFCVFIVA